NHALTRRHAVQSGVDFVSVHLRKSASPNPAYARPNDANVPDRLPARRLADDRGALTLPDQYSTAPQHSDNLADPVAPSVDFDTAAKFSPAPMSPVSVQLLPESGVNRRRSEEHTSELQSRENLV